MKYIKLLILFINGICYSQDFIVINPKSTKNLSYLKTISVEENTELKFLAHKDSLLKLKKDGVESHTKLIKKSHDIIDVKTQKKGDDLKLELIYKTSKITENRNGNIKNIESPFSNLKAFGKYDSNFLFHLDSIHRDNLEAFNYDLLKKEIENKFEIIKSPKDTIYLGEKIKISVTKTPVSENEFMVSENFLTLKKIKNDKAFFHVSSNMFLDKKNDKIDLKFKSKGILVFDLINNITISSNNQMNLTIKANLNDGFKSIVTNSITFDETNTAYR